MYVTIALLPQFTNREDFLQIITAYDDDTGQQLNLTGITLAVPGFPYTSSAWTVTDGAIGTTSTTPITIPVPPLTGQLSALTLTVGTNLNIVPGDAVTIADTATKQNQMTGFVTSYTKASGVLTCQIGWTFQFEIRSVTPAMGQDYTAYYDFGIANNTDPILRLTLGNGITLIDQGTLQLLSPEAQFQSVLAMPYNSQTFACTFRAGLTGTNGVDTRQFLIGHLPILFGGVTF